MPNQTFGLIAHGNEIYGVGSVIFNLCHGLIEREKTPVVIALNEGPLIEQSQKLGYRTVVLDLPPSPSLESDLFKAIPSLLKHRAWTKQASQRLYDCLQEESIDSVTMQWPSHVTFAGIASKRLGCKSYWMMPNEIRKVRLGLNSLYYRSVCNKHNVIPLPNSRYTGKTLSPDPSKLGTEVLYLGIDTSNRFNPDLTEGITRKSLGIDEDVNLFGIFAMVAPRKGQDVFFQAMLEVLSDNENHLLVVGADSKGMIERMKATAKELGVTDRIHFTGWTAKPEEYYPAIDVAVNSRIDPEPFGLSVVEAMSMRKPILVHASGGPAETVLDGQTGWHMPDPSPESFKKGIERAIADKEKWHAMGVAAREHTVKNFSIDAFIENYLAITDN